MRHPARPTMADDPTDDGVVSLDQEAHAPVADAPDVVVLNEGSDEKLPEHATLQDDGSVLLPLRYPVTLKFRSGTAAVREELFEELALRRLTGRDMRAIQSTKEGSVASLAIALSARISPPKFAAIYDLMDGSDANAASQVVSYFLGSGRTTGR